MPVVEGRIDLHAGEHRCVSGQPTALPGEPIGHRFRNWPGGCRNDRQIDFLPVRQDAGVQEVMKQPMMQFPIPTPHSIPHTLRVGDEDWIDHWSTESLEVGGVAGVRATLGNLG